MNIRPLEDRIVIKPLEEKTTTAGGIILPDTVKEKPQRGEVVAAGSGKIMTSGKKAPLILKKGDTVIFGKYAGTEIKVDEKTYIIMKEDEILARIE
ncbi:MAG: co-chaperone GroES [Candidatus Brocadiia bacterium]